MGKSTISMAIFNSYVKLPEGTLYEHLSWWYSKLGKMDCKTIRLTPPPITRTSGSENDGCCWNPIRFPTLFFGRKLAILQRTQIPNNTMFHHGETPCFTIIHPWLSHPPCFFPSFHQGTVELQWSGCPPMWQHEPSDDLGKLGFADLHIGPAAGCGA